MKVHVLGTLMIGTERLMVCSVQLSQCYSSSSLCSVGCCAGRHSMSGGMSAAYLTLGKGRWLLWRTLGTFTFWQLNHCWRPLYCALRKYVFDDRLACCAETVGVVVRACRLVGLAYLYTNICTLVMVKRSKSCHDPLVYCPASLLI